MGSKNALMVPDRPSAPESGIAERPRAAPARHFDGLIGTLTKPTGKGNMQHETLFASPMPGKIIAVQVDFDARVEEGAELLAFERSKQ